MKMCSILQRDGSIKFTEWSYNPAKNTKAYKKALDRLEALGIKNAIITEVAPECFWYSTKEQTYNVEDYE